MRVLYKEFDKNKIKDLPAVNFTGRIIVIFTIKDAEKAVDYLLKQPLLGIDTETRPVFRKGQSRDIALLQVSTLDTCFLFRLNTIGITDAIKRLLEDDTVPKIGLSLKDDFMKLSEVATFRRGLFVDLQTYIPTLGVQDKSLQKLYANFFGMKISKSQRLTNWEVDVLTEKQQQYAAIDAWACLKIYMAAKEMETTGDYKVIDNTVIA